MLSVVVIAKNEARNLPRCLRSVTGIADDVVVVDSGSTDGTTEIAATHGARVFQRAFTTYADQKNWASAQATEPFVLNLDADEALSEELRAELELWKASSPETAMEKAWSMPRLTNYCGSWIRHGGWYPDRKIRLWAAGSGTWKAPEGAVLHEAWVPNDGQHVKALEGDLLHYSYHSTSDHHRQWSKFALLGAADAVRQGRRSGRFKPLLRLAFQALKQGVIQGGWRDGRAGWEVTRWSALAAFWKWESVRWVQRHRTIQRVGVVRTDALGDNVVTLPLAGALKALKPGVEVVWICKPYAESVVRRSVHVDEVRTWSGNNDHDVMEGLDAVVFGFPEPRLLRAAGQTGVPYRVATGRRWSALRWANRRIWRGRKRRPEHEALQGLRLLHGLGLPARWRFPEKEDWYRLTGLPDQISNSSGRFADAVVLHPGNHGSANGWHVKRFEALANGLLQKGMKVVVTGTSPERAALAPWLDGAKDHPAFVDAVGAWSLEELLAVLQEARCVVASSTGPLHIASAVGTPTVGLYHSESPFWPERWGPLGPGKVLATNKLTKEGGLDLTVIAAVEAVLEVVQDERSSE